MAFKLYTFDSWFNYNHWVKVSSQNRLGEDEKERKKKLSFRSIPTWTGIENSKKNSKKIQKIKKHHYGFFSSQNGLGEVEKEKKIIVPISSYQTRIRELKKNSKKIQKFKKHHYAFFSSQNGLGEAEKERKKNYCSDQFLPIQELKIQKK